MIISSPVLSGASLTKLLHSQTLTCNAYNTTYLYTASGRCGTLDYLLGQNRAQPTEKTFPKFRTRLSCTMMYANALSMSPRTTPLSHRNAKVFFEACSFLW
ncbi:hypothetical protein BC938DRAFT_483760 [Jimgerdemannia flammicorona]|uniref:Uncharacterized protein n=1 Tax=Jimgerdemannia flammicorona TaxID=994334 RepID=A0A433QBC1_9FUNG|nr:hypothetical protein BC938DRAFT_483760 [Jimgerdemannia flammicorona]